MSTTAPDIAKPSGGLRARLSAFLYRRRPVKLLLLLAPPLSWIVVVYLAALAVLLFTSLWIEDELSGRIIHTLTLDNFRELWNQPVYRTITKNTLVMAIVVTITDARAGVPARLLHGAHGVAGRCGRCSSSASSCRSGRAT